MRTSELVPFLALFALACGGGDDTPAGVGGMSGSGGMGPAAGGMAPAAGGMAPAAGGMATGSGGMATGSGGMATGSGGMATNNGDYPADLTIDGIVAMINAEGYKGATWKSDRTDINTMPDEFSPHGNMRIWYNQTLRTAHANNTTPPTSGSMVVKEIYTGADVIGHAVMLRAGTSWYYYCLASEDGRCSSSSTANMADAVTSGGVGSCSCHGGGTIITEANIPAP